MAKSSKVDMSEVLGGLKVLKSAKESIARTMGAAMGAEVRDEAKIRAPVLKPGNEGLDNQRPGELRDAIYVAYDDRRNILNKDVYRYTVSWNSKKAPHGHLAEFGHFMPYQYAKTDDGLYFTPIPDGDGKGIPMGNDGFFVSAQPFLGPAFDAKRSQLMTIAVTAGRSKFTQVIK